MANPLDSLNYHGRLVAFEGPPEVVLTQLRLLPPSPQILVLPNLEHYLAAGEGEEACCNRHFIYKIHKAATVRHHAALEFLQKATPDRKRLVFVDGGTVGAQALCISAISNSQTGGDLAEADSVFNTPTSNGLSELLKDDDAENWKETAKMRARPMSGSTFGRSEWYNYDIERGDTEVEEQDPITRAMRAADALDRQTESLQPHSHDVDLRNRATNIPRIRSRSRSLSALQLLDTAQSLGDSFLIDGTPSESDVMPGRPSASASVNGGRVQGPLRIRIPSPPLDCLLETGDMPYPPVSLPPGMYDSDSLVLGCDTCGKTHTGLTCPSKHITARNLEKAKMGSEDSQRSGIPGRPAFDYRSQPPVRVSSRHGSRASSYSNGTAAALTAPQTFFDTESMTENESFAESLSETVLPFVEDLVVQFSDGAPDELIELVIQGFKDGIYAERGPDRVSNVYSQPPMPSITPRSSTDESSTFGGNRSMTARSGEYGPFATPDSYDSKIADWMRKGSTAAARTAGHSLTPDDTPPPSRSGLGQKFCIVSCADHKTAVSTQNALRSLLGSYFSVEDWACHPSDFAPIPETDSLWKPLLTGGAECGRKLDLILAIGAQNGVRREYASAIIKQLEMLGTKPGCNPQGGHLDLRYLIANAMQRFTTQPLTSQTRDNPFTDATTLAALLVPHLSAYLSTRGEIRFLVIEYPAKHLGTVLALQKLIGGELVKVAGILDSGKLKAPSAPGALSSASRDVGPGGLRLSFSGVSYILTSTATDAEIASFISTIRSFLKEVSIPERSSSRGFAAHRAQVRAERQAAKIMTKPKFTGIENTSSWPFLETSSSQKLKSSSTVRTPPSPPPELTIVSPAILRTRTTKSQRRTVYPRSPAPSTFISANRRRSHTVPNLGVISSVQTSKVIGEPQRGRVQVVQARGAARRNQESHNYNYPRGTKLDCSTSNSSSSSDKRGRVKIEEVEMGYRGNGVGEDDNEELEEEEGEEDDDDDDDEEEEEQDDGDELENDDDDGEDDDDGGYDSEERRLMPMFMRRESDKGSGQKALKWLGIA
ncbi:hypothetical protein QBC46DRAFT_402484 [Diplogelasinospora grovesii]|uniref:Uncharacterized protein n=1 Tax=Diplogelasinospora grovesii TaxID=303347 RepID=A0AAN6NHS9_9PEZI|nr:hypothetical protein QBC46DRAFT_402484 [Diplogelasinospora grovesii]